MSFAQYPSLRDRVVFISGGGSGIGASMVEAFVEQGARVAFVDIARAESLALVEKLGGAPIFLECDLTDIPGLERAMDETRRRIGPIQVLINNAANDNRRSAEETSEADWDGSLAVNLKHQFFAARVARRDMAALGGGSIVNFSSTAFKLGLDKLSVYSAAKAAVIGLTTSLAREFGPENIRVNAILPGAVITDRQRRLWISDENLQSILSRQCINQVLLADEVARMALFLAADDSRMITKQSFIVDAGIS